MSKIAVFLHGTALMHRGAVGQTREQRVSQVRDGTDETVREFANYVPVEKAVEKLRRWQEQGAELIYLSSHRNRDDVAKDEAVLARHGFPHGPVVARAAGETYGEMIARERPDILIEDDCESIGADEIAYSQIRSDRRDAIKSIIVPEFGGIDHLPDSLDTLMPFEPNHCSSASAGPDLPWYEACGPEGADAIVLLHAGIADSRMWANQVAAFSDKFRVVNVDLRGFGRSTLLSGAVNREGDVEATLDTEAIDRAWLVGSSLGGQVALEFALMKPGRASGLVLVAPGVRDWRWSQELVEHAARCEAAEEAGDVRGAAELQARFWLQADGPGRQIEPHLVELLVDAQLDAYALPEPDPRPEGSVPLDPPVGDRLPTLTVPTLIILGTLDHPDMLEIGSMLVRELPNADLHMMSDVAHLPPLERPDEFNAVVLTFIEARSA